MPSKVQLLGGHFQDAEGNILALGTLVLELSQDEQITSLTGQIAAGIKVRLALDSSGSVATSPPQLVWPTDVMNPAGASYTVWGYTANGQLAWGPNYGLTVPTGATFDVDNWVPNSTSGSSGGASVGSILLQTNGVNNGDQGKLNLHSSDSSVTITDNGLGDVNFQVVAATSASPAATRYVVPKWQVADTYIDVPAGFINPQDSSIGPTTWAVVQPTVSEASYIKLTTAATSGFAICFNGTILSLSLGLVKDSLLRVATFSSTSVRHWIGLIDDTSGAGGGVLESDTPAANLVAFRYSTNASDTHWQAVCQTDATHQTVVNTGVAIDTTGALHDFEIKGAQGVPGTVLFFIDSVQVASISTNVPPATTFLTYVAYVETLTTVAGSIGSNLQSFQFFQ